MREPYDFVLIVCEGGKTEPNYFGRLRTVCGLANANIRITPADGTDPVSIVRFAQDEYDEHDRVYCVFDRNGHPNFDEALTLARQSALGKSGVLRTITSVPCFELWVLLHFAYSTAPFNKAGSDSPCDRVLRAVRGHFNDYDKGRQDIYDKLSALQDKAIAHAIRLAKHNRETDSRNPATEVHELVEYLRKIKAP